MLKLPLLFYMVGIPGSGKTTFAGAFSQRNKLVHLHADRLGFELYRQPTFSPEERKLIVKEMDFRAMHFLTAGKSVMYDAGINKAAERAKLRKLAARADTAAVGIWVQTPEEVSFSRMANPRLIMDIRVVFDTTNPAAKQSYQRSLDAFEDPSGEPYVIPISGQDSYEKQRDVVLGTLFPK